MPTVHIRSLNDRYTESTIKDLEARGVDVGICGRGTIGGIVNINGRDFFLTCAHVAVTMPPSPVDQEIRQLVSKSPYISYRREKAHLDYA